MLTNLANQVQPLIRYDLGDRVTFRELPCTCGSHLPVIDVSGRCDATLRLGAARHSVQVLPLALSTVLEEEAGLFDFQLIQHGPTPEPTFDVAAVPVATPVPTSGQVLQQTATSKKAKMIRPRPVVRVRGRLTANGANISALTVKAPRGVKITASCSGSGCPSHKITRNASKLTHLSTFERVLRSGTRITIKISKPGGYITKPRGELHAMWNAGRAPARRIEIISPAGFERFLPRRRRPGGGRDDGHVAVPDPRRRVRPPVRRTGLAGRRHPPLRPHRAVLITASPGGRRSGWGTMTA